MDLILWRHAEAANGTPDHSRELTPKGIKQAEKVASFLNAHLSDEYRVLASPSARTQQTAAALTKHFTLAPTIAPGATAHAVLQAARWPDEGGTVVVVGHQPTLGEVAAQLLGCGDCSLSIKKGGVWWFSRREREVTAQITLRLVITPDFL
ncbi:MAG: phosphohistidine phosphatase SixA [Gallionella sp.]